MRKLISKLLTIFYSTNNSGTNFSTFYHNGQEVVQKAPLESNSPWVTKDGTVEIPAEEVADNMAQIGEELTLLQMSTKLLFLLI